MKLAIWSTTTRRENSTLREMFRRQLDEVELAKRIEHRTREATV